MIVIKDTIHEFENFKVLDNINLTLKEQKIGIIGSNGSGKSTFSKLLNGLIIPLIGEVEVDGLNTLKNAKEIRKKVGFVFQNPDNQIVFPTVEEDLAFGLKNLSLSKEETEERINKILFKFNLKHLKNSFTYKLSGGEKQLLAIAGILIMNPKYIIFDEPTSSLDLKNKLKIYKLINNLKQNIIVISHDLDFLLNFDRVIVFDKGKVVMDNIPEESIKYYKNLIY